MNDGIENYLEGSDRDIIEIHLNICLEGMRKTLIKPRSDFVSIRLKTEDLGKQRRTVYKWPVAGHS
jgi:hypothetical protein